ncbi:hypothetical protein KGD83_27670 [Nocardiopsis akebiae]|uniref:Uncharacterized protein n=1 Tax=Nocardiopsis akebiae TaxID=2831968 RepID=A0ABX8C3L5_9ACTN|nr:hypothetical protein [Nocardiopsis akebiae]QUX28923.1 hypothetical protein KGD83_27670 [Nocardiopsis akebiae]
MPPGPERPDRGDRHRIGPRPRTDGREPDGARRVTLTIALVVTFAFLLATSAGLGWFLSDGGPLSGSAPESAGEGGGAGEEDGGAGGTEEAPRDPADGGDAGADSPAGLAYELPGGEWNRLGGEEVPPEYTSYAVLGPAGDPDAVIVTGTEELGSVEPIAVAGVRLAVDLAADLAAEGGVWAEPSGQTDVDGLPAFGATMGGGSGDTYGRFVIVELDDGRGAFMLGVNTAGGDGASEDIDAAFGSVGTR